MVMEAFSAGASCLLRLLWGEFACYNALDAGWIVKILISHLSSCLTVSVGGI